ncbi:MurR/RpiR family transcriptional regulator [Peribacillus frigoritolerans]|jgi:DNA-binding MurR/RpiR family transcriptional regulator|uniref:MurR/RpiR family transcriptional regulator n=2 Tax=Bacillaceae TaxID=186817 RepID=A0AAJ1VD90_9BACI|nr:MurR/RpiR family transcriptional regulator [Peribacillus frigoritolerans]MBX9953503.1 MurR/RpiR family transcriptional regulator [Peribacillus simplex]MCD1159136.1 MurR/RpiR family transcriptional regulator [Peribacillus castrilensis]MDM5286272.1 MurR/RpiR family transcriptional regulator [Peribacillus frigoritolerans]MED4695035.1 MurR/RpiR family transcriptional regulator [Peribacillus frigoritolerans]
MEYLAENLIYGIECSMDKFTKTEEELAHYILQRPEEVSQLTISQIAKKLHISPATITRFCQKLAFSGFNEFRHELKRFVDLRNTPKNMKNIKQVDYFAKLYQDHLGIIDNTFHITTYDNIQKAVSFLTKANKIHVYGIGSSGIAAQEFKSKFFRIGLTVEAITDPHQSMMDAALSNENSVVIGISISGTTKEVISAVKIAKKQGACILVFTGDKNSELSQLGDLTLLVTSKNSMHMGQNISPLLPLLLLFDLLYTELVAKDYKNRISIREKTLKVLTEND